MKSISIEDAFWDFVLDTKLYFEYLVGFCAFILRYDIKKIKGEIFASCTLMAIKDESTSVIIHWNGKLTYAYK